MAKANKMLPTIAAASTESRFHAILLASFIQENCPLINVRFGSLAVIKADISLMTAFGGIADPEAGRTTLFTAIANGQERTIFRQTTISLLALPTNRPQVA